MIFFGKNSDQDEYLVNIAQTEKSGTKVELLNNAELEREHIFALQAAIVRSLKRFKALYVDKLFKLVVDMLERRFVVTQALFEKSVEPLIEKGRTFCIHI